MSKEFRYVCPRCRQSILDYLSELRSAGASREVIKKTQREWLVKIRRGNYWKTEAEFDIFCTNKDIRNPALWCAFTLGNADYRRLYHVKKKFPVHWLIHAEYHKRRKLEKIGEKVLAAELAQKYNYSLSTILRIVHTRGAGK